MQRAKAFLYVCAGIFLLALAYHLGATSAGAQSGLAIEGPGVDRGTASLAVNRLVYRSGGGGVIDGPFAGGAPVPGSSPILATSGYQQAWAITADGKAYLDSGQGNWTLAADFGAIGATPVQRESWGALKQRYR